VRLISGLAHRCCIGQYDAVLSVDDHEGILDAIRQILEAYVRGTLLAAIIEGFLVRCFHEHKVH